MRDSEKQTANEIAALMHDQPFESSLSSVTRNIRTIFRRFSNEGFSFLSKTLPALGKAIDQALSGNLAFSLPTSFKRFKKTCFPHFMGSALRRIFDEKGFLLDTPCYNTVAWIRSVCFYAYKIEVPFDTEQIHKFSESFKATDAAIGAFAFVGCDGTRSLRNLMRSQLADLQDRPAKPAYGPGISSNCKRQEKYLEYTPPSQLRHHFGRDFFHNSNEYLREEHIIMFIHSYCRAFLDVVLDRPWPEIMPSNVLFVPKDSRGPRVICCEDSRMMYAQKALQKSLYSQIERSQNFGGYVNFTDQTINQKLTFDKSNATLDLKDASDRVSLDLVIDVFPQKLVASMLACRSQWAKLPTGEVIRLEKFAPMGSALCFPVMALIAYTAVTSAVYLAGGPLPHRNDRVFVYGDDIIVPNEYAEVAMLALESVGLLVNRAKSFVNSRFLESCGQDTLDQCSVNALRKKRFLLPKKVVRYKHRTVLDDTNGGLPHMVSLYNAAGRSKFYNLQSEILRDIESKYGKLPYGVADSPYLCRVVEERDVSCYNAAEGFEFNGKLRAYVVRDKSVKMELTPGARLRRNLLEGGNDIPLKQGEIGARSTFLQKRTFVKWGTSYA